MKKTGRGFTLVELLIVIVVIGVLAAMMMLSSSEAVSSARASTIITNLRNLKTAALAMYNDNMDYYDTNTLNTGTPLAIDPKDTGGDSKYDVLKYLSGKGDIPDKGDYKLCMVASTNDGDLPKNGWFIIYHVDGLKGTEGARVKDKLKGRAAALGLINMDNDKGNAPQLDGNKFKKYDGTAKYVGLQVR